MPALQRATAWAEERLLGALQQSVPQNGRVHLHVIDKMPPRLTKKKKGNHLVPCGNRKWVPAWNWDRAQNQTDLSYPPIILLALGFLMG